MEMKYQRERRYVAYLFLEGIKKVLGVGNVVSDIVYLYM